LKMVAVRGSCRAAGEQLGDVMRTPEDDSRMCQDGLQCFLDELMCVKTDYSIIHVGYDDERKKRLPVPLGGREQELGNARFNHGQWCLRVMPNKAPNRAARPNAPPLRWNTQGCRRECARGATAGVGSPFPARDRRPAVRSP